MSADVTAQVKGTYARRAPWYDVFLAGGTLGTQARLRRRVLNRLELRAGETVLDLACGTGLNFACIEEAIGPTGQLTGVDISPAMLVEARKRIATHGWSNVAIIEADAMKIALMEPVDAALCTLAVGLMPDADEVVRIMVASVRPGGRVLIADGRLADRWYGALVNPMLRWFGNPWVPAAMRDRYWAVRPWETLQAVTENFHYEEWLGGVLYAAWGRRAALIDRRKPMIPYDVCGLAAEGAINISTGNEARCTPGRVPRGQIVVTDS